ncbi:AMP-binding protein [Corynebacterium glutamicum]|uniref:Acyl-CoA synthetase n=1 Tax=Corynebacterium glutamicum TaxID=1718 RepID=A0AB36IKA8_CORGT|nr:AMP-binding protein [Corynebacterium glutamicum]OKX79573.1 acyl-CoA synthetase [Corynebacterium glutamicum]OKX82531.1 acyl-CoA synthetase [Corynebacterium glutamicum]TWS54684.1 acyl-CoA synthetase [Corynebacterium glutamicum]
MAVTFSPNQFLEETEVQLAQIRELQKRIWPKHVPRDFPEELKGKSFVDIFRQSVLKYPKRTAIEFYGTSITYAQLDAWSSAFAAWLQQHEVEQGDRVGLYLPNCPQFIVFMLGTLKAGLVHVPINPMFKQSELEHEANDAQIKVLISADYLSEIVKDSALDSVTHSVFVDIQELVPAQPTIPVPKSFNTETSDKVPESSWTELTSAIGFSPVEINSESTAALNYTGGTTGVPKGCMHTHQSMVVAGHNCAIAWGIIGPEAQENEVVIAFTPIFWISGENNGILAPLFAGATIVLMSRWDAKAALIAIEKYQVTAMSGVVESYLELLEKSHDANQQLGSLRHLRAMSFSRRLSIDIRRDWEKETGGNSVLRESSFGMTESHTSNTFTTGLEVDDFDLNSEPVFVGLPMPGTDFIIVDPTSKIPVPLGEPGEIALCSPSNFQGYWKMPDANTSTLFEGWVFTGDTGKLSADGALHYLGRQKEMLKVNGMSVFPSEVEVLLSRNPEIESVAVVGHADSHTGQSVHAFVTVYPESETSSEQLEEWARKSMATYKVPQIHILPELPKTATGKIRKADLPEPVTTTK